MGIARVLGDYGHALHYARRVRPGQLTTPERQARYWEDTALAAAGRGCPADAFAALRAVAVLAPDEMTRPWARQLTGDLLARGRGVDPDGLKTFAARFGVN